MSTEFDDAIEELNQEKIREGCTIKLFLNPPPRGVVLFSFELHIQHFLSKLESLKRKISSSETRRDVNSILPTFLSF
jgi:hypothetical protein